MGKNLKNADLVMRTGKLAFYLVPGNTAYTRMEGFTSLSTSKGAKEYSRQYVDEDFERTDITGYATSTSYALDRYVGHPVTDDIILIHENELIGQDAVRSIIQVDMTTAEHVSGSLWKATGKMRDYAVIPDADGDTTDCLTYSGTFKTRGEMEDVEVTSSDDFQTITITGTVQIPLLKSLSIMKEDSGSTVLSPAFNNEHKNYVISETGKLYVMASPETDSHTVNVLYNGTTTRANGKSVTCSGVENGSCIYIIVDNGGVNGTTTSTYTITVSGAATYANVNDEEDTSWSN